jgi:hypothetical protein
MVRSRLLSREREQISYADITFCLEEAKQTVNIVKFA